MEGTQPKREFHPFCTFNAVEVLVSLLEGFCTAMSHVLIPVLSCFIYLLAVTRYLLKVSIRIYLDSTMHFPKSCSCH